MKKIVITDLEYVINREVQLGQLYVPFEEVFPEGPRRFVKATHVLDYGLAWLWYQWLRSSQPVSNQVIDVVIAIIDRCLRLQKEEKDTYWRVDHDVFCAHLAVMVGRGDQLHRLAEKLVSSESPISNDACMHAWSGLWKFWLLGDKQRARQEAEMMYSSVKPINLRLPRKPLVRAWLNEDWDGFGKALKKSFVQSWDSLRKGRAVKFESPDRIEFEMESRSNRTMSHWQENAFALSAIRRGIDLPRDPLWLPSNVS